MVKRISAIGVSLLLLFGAGCGGSEDTSSSPPLSKAAFVKRGDAICRNMETQQIKQLAVYKKAHPDVEKELEQDRAETEKAIVAAAGVAPLETAAGEIGALTPPEGDEEKVDALLAGFKEAAETLEEHPGWFLYSDPGNSFASLRQAGAAYGFENCDDAP